MQFAQLQEQVASRGTGLYDIQQSVSRLRIYLGDALFVTGSHRFVDREDNSQHDSAAMTRNAVEQLLRIIGVPVEYWRSLIQDAVEGVCAKRAMDTAQNMLATSVERYVAKANADPTICTDLVFRARNTSVRAVFRADDVPVRDKTIADVLGKTLVRTPCRVRSFEASESATWMKVTFDGLEFDDPSQKKGGFKAGFFIQNSEIGLYPFSFRPFIYRASCTNDLVVHDAVSDATWKDLDDKGRVLFLRRAVGVAFNTAREQAQKLASSDATRIRFPYAVLDTVGERLGLDPKFIRLAKESFDKEPRKTVFGIVNALTDAAKAYAGDAASTRIAAEIGAGRLLEYAPSLWETLDVLPKKVRVSA